MLDFLLTYARLRKLGDISAALVTRTTETEAALVSLFGDPWRPAYDAFVKRVRELREQGEACVPALALGIPVPGLPPEAAALVANKVIDFRRGVKPKSADQILREAMNNVRRRRRYSR